MATKMRIISLCSETKDYCFLTMRIVYHQFFKKMVTAAVTIKLHCHYTPVFDVMKTGLYIERTFTRALQFRAYSFTPPPPPHLFSLVVTWGQHCITYSLRSRIGVFAEKSIEILKILLHKPNFHSHISLD